MSKVNIEINNQKFRVDDDLTVLQAARKANIDIPTLCYLEDINEKGACRMCIVEVEGKRNLQASCVMPVREGLKIKTHSKRVRESRKNTLKLILSSHNQECLSCSENSNCELSKLCDKFGIDDITYQAENRDNVYDDLSPSIVRDSSKCIKCGRCISVCKEIQNVGLLEFINRGYKTTVKPAYGKSLSEMPCLYCGQCLAVCPVGALTEKSHRSKVWKALEDDDLHVIVQTAPAVRAALGEEFDYPIGTRVTGKMVTALKMLGFDKVFDTNFAADLTIMEEGYELINRLNNDGTLPLITSCSPGWIRYCEFNHPDLLENISSCKSPQQMFGSVAKSYYAEKFEIDPEKIFVVSAMPCTAKKAESEREELKGDVDAVLTTKELAKMIKEATIDFRALKKSKHDKVLGEYTGAGVIFGATGGVMEAALRTVADVLTDKDIKEIEYKEVRGIKGIKEASVKIGDLEVKACVAHGIKNAEKILQEIENGNADYHFVEIMTCPGGCVNGGGQPYVQPDLKSEINIKEKRAKALYDEDKCLEYRKSHQNPEIIKIYEDFLENPNSELAHKLLHTHYHKRDKYHKC
ncbi:MAG: NADH-dependent [FeFe] hydrogenase, group A6 [Bacillota bacterium]